MTRNKTLITILIIAILVGLYYHKDSFRDWFGSKEIQIHHRVGMRQVPARRGSADNPVFDAPVNPVSFGLDRRYRLTSIRVVPISALETNPLARAIWELTTESNSVPVESFFYGLPIRGMQPKIKGVQAEALDPGVQYRLFITAGRRRGEHDFSTTATAASGR